MLATALACTLPLAASGCAERAPKVPGETDIVVVSVELTSHDGSDLTPSYGPLMDRLGMRKKTLVLPGRYYSDFRVHEDRRRIEAFWHNSGFFDVDVRTPALEFGEDDGKQTVAVTWTIEERARYTLGHVELKSAPKAHDAELHGMIDFAEGDTAVDVERFRVIRRKMADHLRRAGHGHARVYSRAFLDRASKKIHFFYYADAGPMTKVKSLVVEGNNKVPAEAIIERSGMVQGQPFSWNDRFDGEFHILDTGAFTSTFIRSDVDTKFYVPGDQDDGGAISDEQIDKDGNLIPRKLAEAVDVKIHVVEAPSQQLRVRAGAELDPSRVDTTLGARLWLRNLFGPLHHMVLEGRAGYGWLYRSDTDDPTGFYGEALARYLKPMFLSRLLDFRLTGRFRDELFPGFHLREVTAGPGIRLAMLPGRSSSFYSTGLFFDADLLFRWGQQVGFGPFDAGQRDAFELADDDVYLGGEVQGSLIWDQRDNPVEALEGYLLAFRTTLSPGGADRFNRYLTLSPEGRGFLPLTSSISVGLKAKGSWVTLQSDDGVPLGPRLFGGGSFGFRGLGRQRLSPYAISCPDPASPLCGGVPVGGLSLAEASAELRFLPKLKPYGAIVFGDVGNTSMEANPFDAGVSFAAGLGLRLRFWYLPAAFDFSYRVLQDNEVQRPEDDPFGVFFRIGEAF
jgi:Omp85 superfamily domain/Surface antigen variable number repeat